MSTNESTPRVGRWTSEMTWACPRPCLSPNHVDHASCDVCHAVRPPLPETPAPDCADCGRPQVASAAAHDPRMLCECATLRAEQALPKPSPRFLTDAQVVGKEPIAGADDAAVEARQHLMRQLAQYTDRDGDTPLTDPYVNAALDAYTAALRAAPVEGDEPVCYAATRDGHPVLPNAIRAHKHEAQRHAELLGPEFYAVPLYAHPAPDGDAARIPAALMRQYEHAAEKAESVGALKMLHKAEAAIGRWCLKAFATPTRSEDRPDAE